MAAVFWALGFVVIKIGLRQFSAGAYMTVRFGLAFFMLLIVFRKQWKRSKRTERRRELTAGVLTGFFLFLAIRLQTEGLTYTTASKSGFITSMNIVILPILGILAGHYRVRKKEVLIILWIVLGLVLLNWNAGEVGAGSEGMNRGDVMTVLCAVFSAMHIFYTGYAVERWNSVRITVIQMGTVAALSLLVFAAEGNYSFPSDAVSWLSVLYAGIFATGAGFLLQAVGQKRVRADAAAMIFASEPVFTAIFAFVLLKERMGIIPCMGAGIMVTGILAYNAVTKKEGVSALNNTPGS